MTDPMITATQHLEAQPKPSYGPHKPVERYLDDEDLEAFGPLNFVVDALKRQDVTVLETLQALETLRTHLRKKYYGG